MARLGIYILLRWVEVTGRLKDSHLPMDKTNLQDKENIYKLAEEFVKDIRTMVHQTDGMRNELGDSLLFEIGTILGQIREKYRRQVDMYRQAYNKFHKLAAVYAPENTEGLLGIHYVVIMEFIVSRQLEIEQLVEIILKVPKEELYKNTKAPFIPPAGANAKILREGEAGAEDDISQEAELEISRLVKEEALKRRYRAEYMKRHGNKA